MIEKLFERIDLDTVIITPNRRLSATFHKLYAEYQIKNTFQAWQQPTILPFSTWIQLLWKNTIQSQFITNAPLLLNDLQEQFLWEAILNKSQEHALLLQVSETSHLVRSAWNLLQQWQVCIEHSLFQIADDYLAFQKWGLEFQKLCRRNQWITQQDIISFLVEKIALNQLELPEKIHLIGFNELNPQQQFFFNTCKNNGVAVESNVFYKKNSAANRISLKDFDTEIITMARWAKKLYHQYPTATIGCVIPNLNITRDRVQQLFSSVFAPETSFSIDPLTSPFNISAGKNLNLYPVINAALQFLTLNKNDISLDKFSFILTSVFLGEAEAEKLNRAKIHSLIKRKNLANLKISSLLNGSDSISQQIKLFCPKFFNRLEQFFKINESLNKNYALSEWAQHFNHLLTALGWPGERSLTSEEFQTVDQWLHLLQQFMTLDKVSEPVSYPQALSLLQKIASKNVFQPKTPETRIQILGVLEAAAIPFEYLWISGMDDHAWPTQANPNPFIPKPLQRELNMPHATAARELHYCKELTLEFQKNAEHVIFSHAANSMETSLHASPLIQHLNEISLESLNLDFYQSPQQRIFHSKKIESILDDIGPSYATQMLEGGVNIIKQQALCPFKAFAECRLKINDIDELTLGLADKDRGSILHKALESIWQEIKNHHTLNLLSEHELQKIIQHSIHIALTNYFKTSTLPQSTYIQLEIQRLNKLLNRWLEYEKQRPTFSVAATEYKTQLNFDNISISIRIDRIDELPDGKKLIIDYKTGNKIESKYWFSERSKEPQLPLYFLLNPADTMGITYAQVNTSGIGFKGVSKDNLQIEGIKCLFDSDPMQWDQQIIQWQKSFSGLIHDFYSGMAKVDPLDHETCQYCHLHSFCRINQMDEFNDCE